MKKYLLIAFMLSPGFIRQLSAQPSSTRLSLKQAIEVAITNNLDARQSELLMKASGVRRNQSRMDLLPDLNGNISHGINEGRSIDPFTNSYINQKINFGNYNLGSSVILFSGLGMMHAMRQNDLAYDASKFEWEQVKENITLNVILAYLQVLSAEEQLTASIRQVEVSRKQVERLETLNKEGAIQPALLYDLQGQLANDEITVIDRQNAILMAKLSLAQLMNMPFNNKLQLEPVTADTFVYDETLTVESIYAEALKQLSVIRATELRKSAAGAAVKTAKSGYFPIIGLNANIYTNYSSAASRDILINNVERPSGDYVDIGGAKFPVVKQQASFKSEKISYSNQFNNNYSSSITVGMRVPLFNGLRTKNQVSLARIEEKNATYIAENSRVQLKQQIEQAYFNMTASYNKYNILTSQVKSFAESFRIAEVKFNAGASTQVDYLIAKNNLDRANINLIASRYDYLLRKKLIDYYQGKLIF